MYGISDLSNLDCQLQYYADIIETGTMHWMLHPRKICLSYQKSVPFKMESVPSEVQIKI